MLIRLYRLVLPRRMRETVASRVSGEARNKLVTLAANVRRHPAEKVSRARLRLWLRLAHRDAAKGRFGHVATVHGRARLGSSPGLLLPAEAAQANLDFICTVLEDTGVEYFRVRSRSYTHNAVAVRDDQREQVIGAVRAALRAEPGYLMTVDRRGEESGRQLSSLRRRTWRRAARASVLRVWHIHVVTERSSSYGPEYACDLEFWQVRSNERLRAAQPNRVVGAVPAEYKPVMLPNASFTHFRPQRPAAEERDYATHPFFEAELIDDVTFPIDIVYTWVDGADPQWQVRRDLALGRVDPTVRLSDQATNDARFMSRDELRYSMRSVAAFAPWVRRIYLVTDRQLPAWLNVEDERLIVVDHTEIFHDKTALPVFNSHAIESQLHHIEGLSEHFVYFNDDVFLGRPVAPSFFFHSNGIARFFPSKALLPMGPRTPADTPVAASGKNNRALIEALTGKSITAKMRHVPHAMRRSVLGEIEERYAELVAATAGHKFRHPDDLAIASSLAHYYGYATGRAVPCDLDYDYVDLAQPSSPRRLNRFLAERRFEVFCLNDTTSEPAQFARQTTMLNWFLEGYFPVPSPFELPTAPALGRGPARSEFASAH